MKLKPFAGVRRTTPPNLASPGEPPPEREGKRASITRR
jgi:hypothetical protein